MDAWLRGHPMITQIGLPLAIGTLYFVAPFGSNDAPIGEVLGLICAALALGVVAWLVVTEVRRAERKLRLPGLLLAFELAIVGFSVGYYLVATGNPAQFTGLNTRLDALYFSLTTMATVGYGDITATGQAGRAMVTVQLVFNLVIVAALVALLQERIQHGRDKAELHPPADEADQT